VTFPLLAKTDVNGPDRHPLYAELTKTPDRSGEAGDVQWNFEKFLLAPDGQVVKRFRPRTAPDAPEVSRLTAIGQLPGPEVPGLQLLFVTGCHASRRAGGR